MTKIILNDNDENRDDSNRNFDEDLDVDDDEEVGRREMPAIEWIWRLVCVQPSSHLAVAYRAQFCTSCTILYIVHNFAHCVQLCTIVLNDQHCAFQH